MSRLRKGGKSTETTKTVPDHADEPSNCIICLERVSCRGKLSVCNHWFCFPCILEWAENTNTCPICKARFRCITKVHVSPFKSPPSKVRVGDKDQRVWNDDDELVAEDILDVRDLDEDDFDDDYEPPYHVENPWTRSLPNRGQQQGRDGRRGLEQISRQLQLDQYDSEDSFIDDTDEALQAFLHSTYNRESVRINVDTDGDVVIGDDENDNDGDNGSDDDGDDDDDDDDDGSEDDDDDDDDDEEEEEEKEEEEKEEEEKEEEDESYTVRRSDEGVTQRDRPYTLRNSRASRTRSSRNTMNSLISQSQRREEQSCPSPASTSSFISNDDESDDDLNNDWVPYGYHKNSGNKGRNTVKTKKQESKKTNSSKRSAGPSTKQSKRSQSNKKQNPNQRRNSSKRKRQQTSISDDEFQEEASSRNGETNNPSVNGWISMANKRTKAHASSSSYPRTRGRASTNKQKGNTRSKGKKPVENIHVESSSDSDEEVLRDRTNILKQPRCSASKTTKDTRNKSVGKSSSRLKQKQHVLSPSTSTHTEMHEDTPSHSSEDDGDNLSDAVIVQPTPCSKATRSIFTKRRHRSPAATFDHSEDTKALSLSRSETQRKRGASNRTDNTVNTHRTKDTETAFAHKSDLQIELSRLMKIKKQKRKRVMTFSSDSD